MTHAMINLEALLKKAADADFFRATIGFVAKRLIKRPIEMEAEGRSGAARDKPSRAEQSAQLL
ncbi:MAG: hypothetical protein ACRECZ_05855 [Methylocella sp.]